MDTQDWESKFSAALDAAGAQPPTDAGQQDAQPAQQAQPEGNQPAQPAQATPAQPAADSRTIPPARLAAETRRYRQAEAARTQAQTQLTELQAKILRLEAERDAYKGIARPQQPQRSAQDQDDDEFLASLSAELDPPAQPQGRRQEQPPARQAEMQLPPEMQQMLAHYRSTQADNTLALFTSDAQAQFAHMPKAAVERFVNQRIANWPENTQVNFDSILSELDGIAAHFPQQSQAAPANAGSGAPKPAPLPRIGGPSQAPTAGPSRPRSVDEWGKGLEARL